MAKHKAPHEEHMDETWLIPYADLLTLLLALFIVLFATSSASEEKLAAMAESFSEEYTFADTGGGSPSVLDGQDALLDMPTQGEDDLAGAGEEEEDGKTAAEMMAEEMTSLVSQLQGNFSTYVEHNFLEDQMEIQSEPEGLLVTLTSDVWFESGSAEINASQQEIAAQVAQMITEFQEADNNASLSVVVSGHTDNVPMSPGSEFKDNWELSMQRAVNFMKVLMNNSTLDVSKFSARGFGEFEPIDTNETEEGRQKNRRVEVFISPEILSAPTGEADVLIGAADAPNETANGD